ncbi:hypothetical protein KR044_003460, partial [Drosophila immigrans]
QVLSVFKKLHRTRQYVFQGDKRALLEGRHKINESFRQNKESNSEEIQKMIKLAIDVDHELRTNIIQALRREDDVYELRITPETTRLDNVVYNPEAAVELPRRRKAEKNSNCCGGAAMASLESESNSTKK